MKTPNDAPIFSHFFKGLSISIRTQHLTSNTKNKKNKEGITQNDDLITNDDLLLVSYLQLAKARREKDLVGKPLYNIKV